MPWYFPWSDSIKKRACRYILQHYVGHFFKEKLSLDQLSLDVYEGKGQIKDVQLDIDAVNEALKSAKSPLELVDGFVGDVTIVIPWSTLMESNITVEIKNLEMTVQAVDTSSSTMAWLTESALWSSNSMALSLQLAQEIHTEESSSSSGNAKSGGGAFDGLDAFAHTIESVLCRVRVALLDTIVRLEVTDEDVGKALELHVAEIEFYDQLGKGVGEESTGYWETPAFLTKVFTAAGIKLFVDESPSSPDLPYSAPASASASATASATASGTASAADVGDIFFSTTESAFQPLTTATAAAAATTSAAFGDAFSSTTESDTIASSTTASSSPSTPPSAAAAATAPISSPMLLMTVAGHSSVTVKSKQKEAVPGVALQIDFQLGALHFFATPFQLHLLVDVVSSFSEAASTSSAGAKGKRSRIRKEVAMKPMSSSDFQRVENDLQRQLQKGRLAQPQLVPFEDELSSLSLDDADDFFSVYGAHARSSSCRGAPSVSGTSDLDASICSGISGATAASSTWYPSSDRASTASSGTRSARHGGFNKRGGLIDPAMLRGASSGTEGTVVRARVSVATLVLTHETPSAPSSLSVNERLARMADGYFEGIASVNCARPVEEFASELTKACANAGGGDHLRLTLKPLSVSVVEKTAAKANVVCRSVDVTMGSFDVVECLFEDKERAFGCASASSQWRQSPSFIPLLSFESPVEAREPSTAASAFAPSSSLSPAISVHLDQIQSDNHQHPSQSYKKLDAFVEIGQSCRVELDVTIVDRLHHLLSKDARKQGNARQFHKLAEFQLMTTSTDCLTTSENDVASDTSVRLDALPHARISLRVRFPIPDHRPPHDVERPPWWRRTLRRDLLHVECRHLHFDTVFRDKEVESRFNVEWERILCSFQMEADDGSEVIHPLLSMESGGGAAERESGSEQPEVVRRRDEGGESSAVHRRRAGVRIHLLPSSIVDLADNNGGATETNRGRGLGGGRGETSSSDEDAYDGAFLRRERRKDPSPFAEKKVIYENEEMVTPGGKEEMKQFVDAVSGRSQVFVELGVPLVSVHLPSKQVLELIYNRLCLDLPLWQPAAPTPNHGSTPHYDPSDRYFGGLGAEGPFMMCKSVIDAVSSDDDDDGDDDTDDGRAFYSTSGENRTSTTRQMPSSSSSPSSSNAGYSKFAFRLVVEKARLKACMNTHYQCPRPTTDPDAGTEEEAEANHAELVADAKNLELFVVAGYGGNSDLQYTCLRINSIAAFFAEEVDSPPRSSASSAPLETPFSPLDESAGFFKLIFTSGSNVLTKLTDRVGVGVNSRDVLSLAVKTVVEPKRNVNTHVVAVALSGVTLRQTFHPAGASPFERLGDFLGILDYPVPGFEPPAVVTELHFHAASCAVDYRPKYLPHAALLTVEQLSISSNLVYECQSSLLRFVIDEAFLHISEKNTPYPLPLNMREDYVCVADIENFLLTLLLNPNVPKKPKIELNASSNAIHFNTCSDSCRILQALIAYIAADGDSTWGPSKTEFAPEPSLETSRDVGDASLQQNRADELSRSQAERVHQNIADAMMESDDDEEEGNDALIDFKSKWQPAGTCVYFKRDEKEEQEEDEIDLIGVEIDAMAGGASDNRPSRKQKTAPSSFQSRLNAIERARDEAIVREVSRDLGCCDSESGRGGSGAAPVATSAAAKAVQVTRTCVEGSDEDDDFCVIEDVGLGVASRDGEPVIKSLIADGQPAFKIEENYFKAPVKKKDIFVPPEGFPDLVAKYTVREMSVFWNFFGGNDFEGSSSSSSRIHPSMRGASSDATRKNDLEGWRTSGGKGRDRSTLVSLCVNKLRFQHEQYPDDTPQASRQIALIHEVEVLDRLEASHVNKLLYQFTSDQYPRQSNANMLQLRALHIRSNAQESPQQECNLKISLMPMAVNVDQDTLFFLKDFFQGFSSADDDDPDRICGGKDRPIDDQPIFTVQPSREATEAEIQNVLSSSSASCHFDSNDGVLPSAADVRQLATLIDQTKEVAKEMVAKTHHDAAVVTGAATLHFDDPSRTPPEDLFRESQPPPSSAHRTPSPAPSSGTAAAAASSSAPSPIFFKSFVFSPEVPIRIDYHGRHVDMQQGPLIGLLVGLTHLTDSQVTLKRIAFRHGILGPDRLLVHTLEEWLNDIKRNQIPYVLGGVGPVSSVVQIVRGIKDLVCMPIEQYRRDGRIILGLQRGTQSFSASTALAAIELSNRAVMMFHTLAETMYDMLSPGPALHHRQRRLPNAGGPHVATNATAIVRAQPADFREGVTNAYQVFYSGIEEQATNIMYGASEGHDQKGVTGAVGGILRQIPPTFVRPFVLASEATANVLGGMRNQIAPEARKNDAEKWRQASS